MKTLLKVLLWVVGVSVALVVIAAVVLPMVVDPNDYKPEIEEQVKANTGRDLRIEGDITLSVFPWLGLDLGVVELGNAPGFAEDLFARSEQVQVRVKLMSLLSRPIEADTVVVDGLVLNLARDAEGRTNWQDLAGAPAAGDAPSAEQPEAPGEKVEGPQLAGLALGGLSVRNATITWNDAQAGQQYRVSALGVRTGAVSMDMDRPIDLEIEFDLEGGEPALAGHVAAATSVDLDLAQRIFKATGLSVKASLTGDQLPGGKATVELGGEAVFNEGTQVLDVPRLAFKTVGMNLGGVGADLDLVTNMRAQLDKQIFDVGGITLHGVLAGGPLGEGGEAVFDLGGRANADLGQQTVALTGLKLDVTSLRMPGMEGKLSFAGDVKGHLGKQTYSVDGLALKGEMTGEALPGKRADFDVGANVSADLAKQTAAIQSLVAKALGVELTGNVDASQILGKANYTGDIKVAEFSPRDLLKRLDQPPVETADPEVLAKASLSTQVKGGLDSVNLSGLQIALDDTTLAGTASVAGFQAPAVRFDLKVNGIDADRYLPPPAEGDAAGDGQAAPAPKPVATPGTAAATGGGLPLDTLRALDIDGRFRLGKLKVANLRVSDVSLTLKAKDGLIRLSPAAAKLYEGTYAGNMSLDARTDEPRFAVDEKLTGIQAGPLLRDLQGEEKVTGKGNFSAKLTGAGATPDAMKRTLNGDVAFQLLDGAVKGVNIGNEIRKARAKLKGQPPPAEEGPQQTDFASMSGTVKLTDGVARNNDLQAKSPLLRVQGKGEVDLVKENLDYLVTTTVVATSKGQGGKELGDLKGIPVPIRLVGTFAQPDWQVDGQALAEALLKGKASEEADKVADKVGEKLDEKLGGSGSGEAVRGLLKGILGN